MHFPLSAISKRDTQKKIAGLHLFFEKQNVLFPLVLSTSHKKKLLYSTNAFWGCKNLFSGHKKILTVNLNGGKIYFIVFKFYI